MKKKLLEITNENNVEYVNFRGITIMTLDKKLSKDTNFRNASDYNLSQIFYDYRYVDNNFILMLLKV